MSLDPIKQTRETTPMKVWKSNHKLMLELKPKGITMQFWLNTLLENTLEFKKYEKDRLENITGQIK